MQGEGKARPVLPGDADIAITLVILEQDVILGRVRLDLAGFQYQCLELALTDDDVKGVDGLGRIVLPKELRTSMKLDNDAKLEIFVEGDEIILKKYRPTGSCDFCGEVDDNAIQYAGYCICTSCRKKIGNMKK